MECVKRSDEIPLRLKRDDVVHLVAVLQIAPGDDHACAATVRRGIEKTGVDPRVHRETDRKTDRPRNLLDQPARSGGRVETEAGKPGIRVVAGQIAADLAVDAGRIKLLPSRDGGTGRQQGGEI